MGNRRFFINAAALALALFALSVSAGAQQPPQQPARAVWEDEFNGTALDESKWERFSFEGAGGGKVEVKDGAVHIRSLNGSRAGTRSRQEFTPSQFSVAAKVAGVGAQVLNPGDNSAPLGFAALTILFDGSGRNRI